MARFRWEDDMPYSSMEDVPASLKGIDPPITLAQANLISEWADSIAASDDPPDSPWAVAISNFKKTHVVRDGRWVKKQSSNLMHNRATAADHRRETMQGRDYLVIPVVAVREGVLNGEFVSGEEIARSVEGWNGRPVVVGHPADAQGAAVSANAPCVLGQCQVGQMFNARYEDDALKGEIWLDVALARGSEQGAEILRRFEQGIPTDVSTAYFRELEADEGEHGGRAFNGRAVDLMPDHLALLLDDAGACSWRDGCGAPRTNADESLDAQLEVIRRAWSAQYDRRDVPVMAGPWVEEIFDAFIVVTWDGQYWRVPYTMTGEEPQFADRQEWTRVEQQREWVPAEETELSENAVQKVVKAIVRALSPHKEKDMTQIEELLQAGVPFEQDALEAMSDEQIDFLARQAAPPQEPPAANEDEDEGTSAALRGSKSG